MRRLGPLHLIARAGERYGEAHEGPRHRRDRARRLCRPAPRWPRRRISAAPTPAAIATPPIQEIVVTADRVGLLEKKPSATVFGLGKPLLETPRSATFVSDVTIQRYGATSVNDLIAIAPGSFTASYYGVPGSLNLRGTLAENYFRGFKRIEDRGTYSTPIGDAAEIEIVRGPPTPIYGPGKVGGFLNFEPKTAEDEGKFPAQPTGEATLTYGQYNLYQGTLQGGAPVTLGPVQGGVYGYGEASSAHSYYHGIYPSHQMLELSSDLDFGSGWSAALGGMYYHDDGDIQTPGWNRLTQNLIDNGTYITGRNTVLVDSNHDGRLEPGEVQPGGVYPFGTSLLPGLFRRAAGHRSAFRAGYRGRDHQAVAAHGVRQRVRLLPLHHPHLLRRPDQGPRRRAKAEAAAVLRRSRQQALRLLRLSGLVSRLRRRGPPQLQFRPERRSTAL